MILTILSLLALLVALQALLLTIANLARYRSAAAAGAGGAGGARCPTASICVPARNEAANLEPCVRSLLAQEGIDLEVLVYDDQSTDGTPAILARLVAEDARVRAVPTAPLPEGWNGKQWGCDRMGRAAKGEWLLFTDADVRFAPDCVARAVAEARRSGAALLSTFPRQEIGSIGEGLLVPMIHFILLSYLPIGRMRSTLDPAASAACGQFLLAQREAWEASGGHAAFRDSMHDGVRMPRCFRRAGFRTDLFDGTGLVRVRMYRGFVAAWRGFAKNAFEGLGSVTLLVVLTVLHGLGHVFPWILVLAALLGAAVPTAALALAAAAVTANLLQRVLLARRFQQPWWVVPLHPVAATLMTAVQWWSLVLHRSGRRSWKGRTAGPAVAAAGARR